jgi:hypothetical protein
MNVNYFGPTACKLETTSLRGGRSEEYDNIRLNVGEIERWN